MIIVTTPMCKKIVEIAGLTDFKVNKHPDEEIGDLAILLSESKVQMPSISIKLNTFDQIKESILILNDFFINNHLVCDKISEDEILSIFEDYEYFNIFKDVKIYNSNKKVKVYSKFLKDIVEDLGCDIVDDSFKYIVFPDYLTSDVLELNYQNKDDFVFIKIPTHSNTSSNPLIRANERYSFILNNL